MPVSCRLIFWYDTRNLLDRKVQKMFVHICSYKYIYAYICSYKYIYAYICLHVCTPTFVLIPDRSSHFTRARVAHCWYLSSLVYRYRMLAQAMYIEEKDERYERTVAALQELLGHIKVAHPATSLQALASET